ncbi:MAG: methionine aminotransferase [Candidatus Azotimanducaceae bacterium]
MTLLVDIETSGATGLIPSSKLPTIGTTIFTVMSQLAAEQDAINLSQGFPDFAVPEALIEMLAHYLRAGYNQYPPMTGVPYLRAQIAVKSQRLYSAQVDSDTEVTVTSGATEALNVAIQTVVHPGDEVIVFDPAYDAYEPAVTLCQGLTRHIPLLAPDFAIDWQRLRDTINPKTRMVIVNSPHNPTGSILDEEDLAQLADLLRGTGIYLLADEVYEHMVFDGACHASVLGHAELRERAFVVSSFGKTCHATGWKVGYCIAPPALTAEFRKIHQFVTFTTHTPTQWALAEFIDQQPEHYLGLSDFYQAKRDFFLARMVGSGFSVLPSHGTYFQLADYSGLSDMPDTEFARFLTVTTKVAAIPVSVFCAVPPATRLVRFCFAKQDDTLRQAAERLHRVEAQLHGRV